MESKDTYHVVVAGAGPTGLMTAYELAQRGFKVLCLDKRSERTRHYIISPAKIIDDFIEPIISTDTELKNYWNDIYQEEKYENPRIPQGIRVSDFEKFMLKALEKKCKKKDTKEEKTQKKEKPEGYVTVKKGHDIKSITSNENQSGGWVTTQTSPDNQSHHFNFSYAIVACDGHSNPTGKHVNTSGKREFEEREQYAHKKHFRINLKCSQEFTHNNNEEKKADEKKYLRNLKEMGWNREDEPGGNIFFAKNCREFTVSGEYPENRGQSPKEIFEWAKEFLINRYPNCNINDISINNAPNPLNKKLVADVFGIKFTFRPPMKFAYNNQGNKRFHYCVAGDACITPFYLRGTGLDTGYQLAKQLSMVLDPKNSKSNKDLSTKAWEIRNEAQQKIKQFNRRIKRSPVNEPEPNLLPTQIDKNDNANDNTTATIIPLNTQPDTQEPINKQSMPVKMDVEIDVEEQPSLQSKILTIIKKIKEQSWFYNHQKISWLPIVMTAATLAAILLCALMPEIPLIAGCIIIGLITLAVDALSFASYRQDQNVIKIDTPGNVNIEMAKQLLGNNILHMTPLKEEADKNTVQEFINQQSAI